MPFGGQVGRDPSEQAQGSSNIPPLIQQIVARAEQVHSQNPQQSPSTVGANPSGGASMAPPAEEQPSKAQMIAGAMRRGVQYGSETPQERLEQQRMEQSQGAQTRGEAEHKKERGEDVQYRERELQQRSDESNRRYHLEQSQLETHQKLADAQIEKMQQEIALAKETDPMKAQELQAHINELNAEIGVRQKDAASHATEASASMIRAQTEQKGLEQGKGGYVEDINEDPSNPFHKTITRTPTPPGGAGTAAPTGTAARKLDAGKPEDIALARQYLKKAGGDKAKAKQLMLKDNLEP